jgi:hypothetical protein
MNTIILSVIGIVLLIAISFLFSVLEWTKGEKADQHLANIRKSLARKSDWLLNSKHEIDSSAFRRTKFGGKLNLSPNQR